MINFQGYFMSALKTVSALILLVCLSGCGLKYDLYMPDENDRNKGSFLIVSSENSADKEQQEAADTQ